MFNKRFNQKGPNNTKFPKRTFNSLFSCLDRSPNRLGKRDLDALPSIQRHPSCKKVPRIFSEFQKARETHTPGGERRIFDAKRQTC